jgi:hypothetical protein
MILYFSHSASNWLPFCHRELLRLSKLCRWHLLSLPRWVGFNAAFCFFSFLLGKFRHLVNFKLQMRKLLGAFLKFIICHLFLKNHLLGFSTVANNRERFFELFYFHIYLIHSQINLAKSYYGWSLLGLYYTIVMGWGPNTEGWVTPAFLGKFHRVLIFFSQNDKKECIWGLLIAKIWFDFLERLTGSTLGFNR